MEHFFLYDIDHIDIYFVLITAMASFLNGFKICMNSNASFVSSYIYDIYTISMVITYVLCTRNVLFFFRTSPYKNRQDLNFERQTI